MPTDTSSLSAGSNDENNSPSPSNIVFFWQQATLFNNLLTIWLDSMMNLPRPRLKMASWEFFSSSRNSTPGLMQEMNMQRHAFD
jgi:hypothetical protein